MDHDEAVRQKATEKYLLDELDPEQRDQFEEHLFDCQDCALDMRATAMFIEQSRGVFSQPQQGTVSVPASKPGWLAWFRLATIRPAFAIPALAALLAVVGYQNLVTVPQLTKAMHQPQFLAYASLNIGTRGVSTPISVRAGEDLVLSINVPPARRYSSYALELLNAAGDKQWSLAVPAEMAASSDDAWPVKIPTAGLENGNYTVVVRGVTATGENEEVGRSQFALQIQNPAAK